MCSRAMGTTKSSQLINKTGVTMTVIMLSLTGSCSILRACGIKWKALRAPFLTGIMDRRVSNILRLSCSFRCGVWAGHRDLQWGKGREG